jgi:hypothetical protein
MPKLPVKKRGDATPVTGGIPLPDCLDGSIGIDDAAPSDDLGRQAYWLLKMNAGKVSLKFRKSDLASMDDGTKRQLIADIQRALGVAPFKKSVL